MVFLLVRPFSAKRVLGVCASREHWGGDGLGDNGNHRTTSPGQREKTVDGPTVLSSQHQEKEAELF